MKLLQLLEATDRILSMNDAIDIVREIETGRGGIAELVGRKPALTQMSQDRLRQTYGDVVPLFRALSIPEGKERRPDEIVSTSTDWKVAYHMVRDMPGVVMGRNGFISMQKVLLRYDTPIDQCLADVNMLLEMVIEALGGFEKIGNQQIRGRSGAIAVAHIIKEGMKEDEVIADVRGVEPVVLEFESHVSGRGEMEMLHDMEADAYNSPDEYMAHRLANKGSNEFFPPEEQEQMKAMYAKRAPHLKRFLGKESIGDQIKSSGIRGFGGMCFPAAIEINERFFGGAGDYVIAYNKAFMNHGHFFGHVAVLHDGVYWDSDGRPKDVHEIESWGMLDEDDPEYQELAQELGFEFDDSAAYDVGMNIVDEETVRGWCKS